MKLSELMNIDLTGRSSEYKAKVLKEISTYANKRVKSLLSNNLTKYSPSAREYKKGFKTSISIGKRGITEATYNKRVMNEINRVREFLDNESSTIRGAKRIVKKQIEGLLGNNIQLTENQRKRFFNIYTKIKDNGDLNSLYGSVKKSGSINVARVVYDRLFVDNKGKSRKNVDIVADIEEELNKIYEQREINEEEILEDLEDEEREEYTTEYKF